MVLKKGKWLKKWKFRWFVVGEDTLKSYRTTVDGTKMHHSKKAIGVFDLGKWKFVDMGKSGPMFYFKMENVLTKESYMLKTGDLRAKQILLRVTNAVFLRVGEFHKLLS